MAISNIFKLLTRISLAISGLSAVSSCAADSVMRADYGTPYADYAANGTVTDGEDNPIQGIRVVRGCEEECFFDRDTAYTDANGKFAFGYDMYYILIPDLKFEDIDGEDNGGYFEAKTLTDINYEKTGDGDGDWYDGKFSAEVTITLKKK